MKKSHNITHMIFDMDGLLLDTEPFYTEVTQQIINEFGKTFTWALKSKMMGLPSIISAKILVDTLSIPISPEEYLKRRSGLLTKLFPTAQPKPGSKSLTKKAKAMKIPLAVATSTAKSVFTLKTQKHKEWFNIFDIIITGDNPDIKNGKPSPDIFLLAAKKMEANPKNCLVFEDSISGVEAAIAAGMHTIAVPDQNLDKKLFQSANKVLNSLNEFNFNDWKFNITP